jgi:deoxyinosine 3'endonuclease (endonuclease V)
VGHTARVVPVAVEEDVVGAAVYSSPRSGRQIFVSPGTGVDLPYALSVVRRMLHGRRLPEPQYHADRASRTPAS